MQHSRLRTVLTRFSLTSFSIGALSASFLGHVYADLQGSAIFPDVQNGAYYDSAVGAMYQKGIITGYQNGNFGPDDPVTRGQVAVMMQRFMAQIEGGSVSSRSSRSSSDNTTGSNRHGLFRFTSSGFDVNEASGTVQITVVRTGGDTDDVTVKYKSDGGTATAGEDYTAISGTLSFKDGETSKTISLNLKNDEIAEDPETIKITLEDAGGGAGISSPSTLEVRVLDNDGGGDSTGGSSSSVSAGAAGRLGLSATKYALGEDQGSITITVERTEDDEGSVTVEYETSNGTATSGDQYEGTSGTLTFDDGVTTKTFTITLHDNEEPDGNKTANIHLKNPTGGAVLGTSTATLTIADDEVGSYSGTGSLKLDDDEYEADEGDTVEVPVLRIGGSKGSVKVDYSLTSGSAKSGSDFTANSGTLTFREGEIAKLITIKTISDNENESTESFSVSISNPTNGAQVTSPLTAEITLYD